MLKKLSCIFWLLYSIAYIVYYSVFYDVVKTNASVMQLEDNDIGYAIGSSWAQDNDLAYWILLGAIIVLIYTSYQLFIKNSKDEK